MLRELQFVQYEAADRIGYVTLNRPDKRNALNFTVVAELKDALARAMSDETVKVIVLRANGQAFCAGADLEYLKRLQSYTPEENLQDSTHLMELFLAIYRCPKPVIAQVEGHAVAGGCGLVTVCDFAFTVPEAKFGYSEVRIGFLPAIVMLFLIRKLGELRAKELLLTGALIDADRAERINLVNQVVPAASIADHVRGFARMLCEENSAQSMALTKKMMGDIQTFPVEEALKFAARMNAHARATEDCHKGITAFLNKEKPVW